MKRFFIHNPIEKIQQILLGIELGNWWTLLGCDTSVVDGVPNGTVGANARRLVYNGQTFLRNGNSVYRTLIGTGAHPFGKPLVGSIANNRLIVIVQFITMKSIMVKLACSFFGWNKGFHDVSPKFTSLKYTFPKFVSVIHIGVFRFSIKWVSCRWISGNELWISEFSWNSIHRNSFNRKSKKN